MKSRTWLFTSILVAFVAWSGSAAVPQTEDDGDSIWSVPVNLGSTVNSAGAETQVAITHSGLSLYFASDRAGGYGNSDIWVSHRLSVDAPWEEPRNLGPSINGKGAEFAPSFSPDDHWMFFPSGGRSDSFGSLDIYMTYREDVTDDFGWQPAENLGLSVNSAKNDADPFYFVDPKSGEATLYFVSNRFGTFDIFQSTRSKDGSFLPAVLNRELSTAAYSDRRMTIRRDGLELIFTSDRPGGVGGLDLWVSTREDTHQPWSEPVNLGPGVNTVTDERGPALSKDGLTLYFSSDREGGMGAGDVWMTTRSRELKHRSRDWRGLQ